MELLPIFRHLMVSSSRHLVDTTLKQVSSLRICCNYHTHMQNFSVFVSTWYIHTKKIAIPDIDVHVYVWHSFKICYVSAHSRSDNIRPFRPVVSWMISELATCFSGWNVIFSKRKKKPHYFQSALQISLRSGLNLSWKFSRTYTGLNDILI